ncbi:MAG: HAD family hydrolase [Clostridia bacterium]|nr:HAD family hydrolase [Clostridia bacterium]
MRKNKTLYVSDLDGTLLNSNQSISDFTAQVINNMVEKGMVFTYATARSAYTACPKTSAIKGNIPLIIYNGVFIINNETGEKMLSSYFNQEQVQEIKSVLDMHGIYPIVYSFIDNREKFSFCINNMSRGIRDFTSTRENDERRNEIIDLTNLYKGENFYYTCIDDKEKLLFAYDKLKNKYRCIFSKDIYSNDYWLEIMPKGATKANAVLKLKEMLGCDKIVSFGDNVNDIEMFKISHECYAVENAVDELKEYATGIIESNDNDGVAKWLNENAGL